MEMKLTSKNPRPLVKEGISPAQGMQGKLVSGNIVQDSDEVWQEKEMNAVKKEVQALLKKLPESGNANHKI